MGSWTALISSALIGTLVLLSLMQFNQDVSADLNLDMLEHVTYNEMAETVDILKFDLNRIGLGINDPSEPKITLADSTALAFWLDIEGDGIVDSIRYVLGDLNSASATENPRDRILYRVVNSGAAESVSSGLTSLTFKYYDNLGNETSDPSLIRTVEVSLTFESTIIYDGRFARLAWQGKISPPNLVSNW
ncbi:MAG: hypothetical protein D6814_07425 [Calditrichaeota bacterium]|nr:MAG: hypothetical protein D6814_07425 [Calditrichota bacterium]